MNGERRCGEGGETVWGRVGGGIGRNETKSIRRIC